MPSNGATIFWKPDSSRRRCTFARAACTCASFDAARLIFSSASCLETESEARRLRQRSAVTLGDLLIGLRGREVRLRLAQLLIDFRRLDLTQQLAGLDRRADVHQPALQIAAGARVDRRLVVGLEVARQDELGQIRLSGCGFVVATVTTDCASVASLSFAEARCAETPAQTTTMRASTPTTAPPEPASALRFVPGMRTTLSGPVRFDRTVDPC